MTTHTEARQAVVAGNAATDTWHVLTRELKPIVRDPFTLIFSLVQPLVFLGLFAPLLIGQSGASTAETLQWFVPGTLVMIVLFGTGATGSNLQYEMMTGSHERTLVAPLARSSLLVGRALKEIAPIIVQSLVIVAIAWPFGFAPHLAGMLDRAGAAGRLRRRARLAVLRPRAGDQGPRMAVLGRAADADLPAADPLRHAPAAGRRPRLDARRSRP